VSVALVPSRESAATKARRLLADGRVIVRSVNGSHVDAQVRGDSSGVYRVTHEPGSWHCDCPALGACSHIRAVMLITAVGGMR
jgi:uncharacterized Zn finger protein